MLLLGLQMSSKEVFPSLLSRWNIKKSKKNEESYITSGKSAAAASYGWLAAVADQQVSCSKSSVRLQ